MAAKYELALGKHSQDPFAQILVECCCATCMKVKNVQHVPILASIIGVEM